MNRKGISPLIAAVLLIAFTMAVASLFAQWAPSLIQEAQGETKNTSGELQRCSSIILEITNVDDSNDRITIQQVSGDNSAGNISVTFQFASAAPTIGYGEITSNRGVDRVTSGTTGDITDVRAVAKDCQGAPAATWP